jgi:ParB family transcriptional regulator, chromosome partitioning protein
MSAQGLIQELPIIELHRSPNALRDQNDRDTTTSSSHTSIMQLASSIEQKGLLQPITVRAKDSYFEIVAGHRRFEACKVLGRSKIMCHIIEANDREAFEMSLIENLQQRSMNPIEEAKAFKQYISNVGWGGQSDLSRKIGKSQEYISRRIRLLDLPEEMQREIMRHRINPSMAQELFSLDSLDEESADIQKFILNNGLNTKQAREVIRVVTKAPYYSKNRNDSAISSIIEPYSVNNSRVGILNSSDRGYDTVERELARATDLAFRKCILAVRISMKTVDMVLEKLETDLQQNNEDRLLSYRYKRKKWYNKWVLREMLMQHRLQLHAQLDIMLREQQKVLRTLSFK